jgi:feruloyl esterase
MKSMQMYPEDYDLYAIGGHSEHTTNLTFGQWAGWQLAQDPQGNLSEKLGILAAGALEACDADDGLKDGVINAPNRCKFDTAALRCTGVETQSCLTDKQVDTARKLYAPVRNSRTGEEIQGPRYPGSELTWGGKLGEPPRPFAVDFAKYLMFSDASWDYRQNPVNFDEHVAKANASPAALGNAIDPKIAPFFARGGKLLMHQGWNDGNFVKTPINYHDAVLRVNGAKADESMRLFMVPGTGHCVDGRSEYTTFPGAWRPTRTLDTLGALRAWHASGKAPDKLLLHVTERSNHKDVLLCPYPSAARYKGKGDPADPASFECRK